MSKREAEINITGNTDDARASIKDLENFSKKSFNQMSEDAKKEAGEVADAFQKSGVRMEKDIKKSSADARKNYKKIKDSGTASSNDIRRAHNAMTRKIAANNRELKVSNGLVSKGFKLIKSNILATTLAVTGIVVGLKKAFDFVETSAKLKAQKLAFRNFTESLGEDADELIAKLKETSKGTVAQSDLIKSAGTALLLGLDPSKIVKLMEIARASAKLTGESLTQLFEDVAKGTGRASKLILDNLGIQFSQGEATRRAAEALGVKKDALTANQIATGNLNEVIRQGQPIIEGVGKDFVSQADVLAKIKARYTDLVVVIGQKFLKFMPKVELFVLKASRAFLIFASDLSKSLKLYNQFTDFLGLSTGAADRAQFGIDNLSKGVVALDTAILNATNAQLEFAKAEESAVETSKEVIALAKEKNAIREKEEGIIISNLETTINAINKAAEAQKAQNELLKKNISATKKELRELESEVKRAADFTQTILDEIDASTKRRAQSGFDPLQKLVDDLKRAEENFKKAAEERTAGNVERASELTLSAVQAANAILEVKKDADDDSEITNSGLKKATTEAEKLVASAKKFTLSMEEAANNAVPAVVEKLATMESELALGKASVKGVKAAIADAQAAAERLKNTLGQDTTATHTQIINTVNTGGGNGGPGFNTGGHIPGYGGGDTVPIMAEPGEHVIRKESVKKIGRGAAQAFNRGDIAGLVKALPVQYFNEGGEVKGQGGPAANVNLIMGDKTFPVSAEQSVAEEFIDEIKNLNTIHGRKKQIY